MQGTYKWLAFMSTLHLAFAQTDPKLQETTGETTVLNLWADDTCGSTPTSFTPTASAENCTSLPQDVIGISVSQRGYDCQREYCNPRISCRTFRDDQAYSVLVWRARMPVGFPTLHLERYVCNK